MAITAAAMIPLAAIIGSGLDMSRAYMAQARLQQACDAGTLAGRRVMTNDTLDSTVTTETTKFFNFNFPQGAYQTAAFTPTITRPDTGIVRLQATTTIPLTVMKMFGYSTLTLNVDCKAEQNFVNTDIVLVLDTTGSMADKAVSSDTSTKIVALRAAVLALYDQLKPVQDQLAANGLRMRYGIVPYASAVNVGKVVRAVNSSYIVSDNWTYQTRQPASIQTNTKNTCQNNYGGAWNSSTKNCSYFTYGPRSLDVSSYVTGNAVTASDQIGMELSNPQPIISTWAGCIEERQTVSTITSASGYTIPSGAKDLDTNLVPTSDKTTKWVPYWPDVEYNPDTGSHPQVACPTEAKRLTSWTRADLNTYLNTLNPDGGTYHDNGMIWGARFISPNGIFGADNPTTYGNMPVSKFIIFMTDGMMDTGSTLYSSYGMENWDKRVTGGYTTDADSDSRHNQRFLMSCNAAKGMDVSIWVVAFASSLDSNLTSCASNSNQAATVANQAALLTKFTEIGKAIGSLRLTQ